MWTTWAFWWVMAVGNLLALSTLFLLVYLLSAFDLHPLAIKVVGGFWGLIGGAITLALALWNSELRKRH